MCYLQPILSYFKWRNNISRKDHFQILLSESGITDCKLISGEFISTQEQYMGRTNTAFECAREVKVIAPDADGMTWTLNSMECWAKYGSSNSTIDTNGCSYCQSCVFGIVFLHISNIKLNNETLKRCILFNVTK